MYQFSNEFIDAVLDEHDRLVVELEELASYDEEDMETKEQILQKSNN